MQELRRTKATGERQIDSLLALLNDKGVVYNHHWQAADGSQLGGTAEEGLRTLFGSLRS